VRLKATDTLTRSEARIATGHKRILRKRKAKASNSFEPSRSKPLPRREGTNQRTSFTIQYQIKL